MPLSLQQLNAASQAQAIHLLDGLYEHSPWVVERACLKRPFASLAALKHAYADVVSRASREEQLGLIRAHPELAGKAMVAQSLTAESTNEQSKAGLTNCTPEEFDKLQQLNRDYNAKFGWPFILAVRGPRGLGFTRQQIIAHFERRLHGHPDFELHECLRQIHRIAEIRLADKFGAQPTLGDELWDWHEDLAQFSDPEFKARGELTVTYLTDAHRACAQRIAGRMRDCGFDSVEIDVLGNVLGRYEADSKLFSLDERKPLEKTQNSRKYLMTGSHYDTVRNGGKYDGRLGIFAPMMAVRQLHKSGKRLPFGIEVVAFSEEEGQRFKATFLASSALTGEFNPAWLEQQDSEGNQLFARIHSAYSAIKNEAFDVSEEIAKLKRDPDDYLGFVEIHIEQGPVLNELNLPLGVVTSINGSVRLLCEIIGQASHAGTTPMDRRRDAAAAAAELVLYVEQRASQDGDKDGDRSDRSVGTVGMLHVPSGSINVVPGRCAFSLDLRAPNDAQRDALVRDVLTRLDEICKRRNLAYTTEEVMRASAAPSDAAWQARWARAVQSLGLPVFHMPSGAGHDAMKLHTLMPQAMLFVRGENSGISHNPLESTTSHDMQLAVEAFTRLLEDLAAT
jgi:beta-ureidopropionase / N-carbamoyl-L-amino-acid hydrolase